SLCASVTDACAVCDRLYTRAGEPDRASVPRMGGSGAGLWLGGWWSTGLYAGGCAFSAVPPSGADRGLSRGLWLCRRIYLSALDPAWAREREPVACLYADRDAAGLSTGLCHPVSGRQHDLDRRDRGLWLRVPAVLCADPGRDRARDAPDPSTLRPEACAQV